MNVLEKILEEIKELKRKQNNQNQDYRTGYFSALSTVEGIIRSHMGEKEKVLSAEIISKNIDGKPYYEIKYKKVGEDNYTVGYSSYKLDYVVNWLNEYFEFCGEAKVSVSEGKNTNVPSKDGWISVEEGLPEDGQEVLVWYEYFRYGEYNRMFKTYGIGWQFDGHWSGDVCGTKARCIAWQPLPEQYKPEQPKPEKNTQQEIEDFWIDK